MNLIIQYFFNDNNPRLKSWVIILCILFISTIGFAQTAKFDSLVHVGINQIYALQFENAQETYGLIKKENPKHPFVKFFPAMITWWKIMVDLDDEQYDDLFVNQLNETINFCDDLLEKNPNNVDALFFKGGALGFRGRFYSIREEWLDAAADGKDALPLVNEAYKLDPKNVDVQFGFGIYNYYAEVIPEKYTFLKPIMFFFPKGDRTKGIKQLLNASKNGKYTRVESKYFLMTLYYQFEDDNSTALNFAKELIQQFPNNSTFHKYYARLLRRVSEITKSTEEFEEIYNRCINKQIGYGKKLQREAAYYIADKYWRAADFDQAIKFYKECSDLSISFDQEDDGFNVVSLLLLGKIYDHLGDRKKAIFYYEEVLDLDEYNNSHKTAKELLKSPFKR
ncbi:MAG: tetratricopeptide repeat protein [Melioribacteraceae bacterium]|nr:MAG: tetratricopeptide repeat protein [Melioribacteraceae bacterium]